MTDGVDEKFQRRGATSTARVQRFRRNHRRIEYVPRASAIVVIEQWRGANPGLPLSAILDHLVVAGNGALLADAAAEES